jgi:RNA polymerase sigma-70 factor (ECF subfamily)
MNTDNKIVDGWLVLQYQSGNKKSLPLLVKRWHKKMCNKAYWVTKDKEVAKDIAQDSWKTIMSKIHKLKAPNSFGSWALTIVYRKAIDLIKEKQKERDKLFAYNYEQDAIVNVETVDNTEIKKILLKAINSLSEQHQMVINLFYVEAYSLLEIGEILGISIGTAKSRLFHAREKLKITLKTINYEN